MIRLTQHYHAGEGTVIRVDGALGADSIGELRLLMEGLAGPISVDLAGVTRVDRTAAAHLRKLRSAGVELRDGSLYVSRLLNGPEEESMSDSGAEISMNALQQAGSVTEHPANFAAADPENGPGIELLQRLRGGDETAFEELLHLAVPRLLALARRMLGREEDAQDAVQEAFLSAFKSLANFDGRSQLTTWLHRITVNVCLMRLRTRRRRPEASLDELLPVFLSDGHQAIPSRTWQASGEGSVEQEEVRALVREKIDQLPDQYRVVLVLRDIEELSTEETAEALGMTVSAVKTRLHRARQALRTLLDPHFSEGC